MKDKVITSIKNYEKAYSQLEAYLKEPVVTDRDRSGVIQAFEFTYEVAWKTFKKAAEYEGREASSPRDSLKQAYILNIIENDEEQEWIDILKHRNITSHTYKEELASMILDLIETKYRHLFASSLKRLKERYE